MAGGGGQRVGSFDYIIVGAGTAGCVLANRLSADARASVLLLEAGGKDSWIWIHIPIGYLYTQNNPRTGWGWDDVLPYFKKSEDHAAGADEVHGAGGEWRIEQQRLSWEILDAFREAAAEVGIPKIADFNRGNNEGCAYFQVTQRKGVRWSTAKAFLRPAKGRANLTVLTGAQATGVLFEGRRAVALRFRQGGQDKRASAG